MFILGVSIVSNCSSYASHFTSVYNTKVFLVYITFNNIILNWKNLEFGGFCIIELAKVFRTEFLPLDGVVTEERWYYVIS